MILNRFNFPPMASLQVVGPTSSVFLITPSVSHTRLTMTYSRHGHVPLGPPTFDSCQRHLKHLASTILAPCALMVQSNPKVALVPRRARVSPRILALAMAIAFRKALKSWSRPVARRWMAESTSLRQPHLQPHGHFLGYQRRGCLTSQLGWFVIFASNFRSGESSTSSLLSSRQGSEERHGTSRRPILHRAGTPTCHEFRARSCSRPCSPAVSVPIQDAGGLSD